MPNTADSGYLSSELMYERGCKTHMNILRDLWSMDKWELRAGDQCGTLVHVSHQGEDKRAKQHRQNYRKFTQRTRRISDKKSKFHELKPGDKVLVLLRMASNKLDFPVEIVAEVTERHWLVNYTVCPPKSDPPPKRLALTSANLNRIAHN